MNENDFEKTVESFRDKPKKRENWIIVYKGKQVFLTTNEKHVWNESRFAKNALTAAFETYFNRNNNTGEEYKNYRLRFRDWAERNIKVVKYEDFYSGENDE